MDNKEHQWHQAKIPFFLEVEYYDEYNSETESKILKSLLFNQDLLPGLRVNKMFANCVDKDVLIADEIQNDLKYLKDAFDKFVLKYKNYSDDHKKDICINKLRMKTDDFSTYEKEHVEEIQRITANGNTPKIDRNTGRYKAYDDPTNFPQ